MPASHARSCRPRLRALLFASDVKPRSDSKYDLGDLRVSEAAFSLRSDRSRGSPAGPRQGVACRAGKRVLSEKPASSAKRDLESGARLLAGPHLGEKRRDDAATFIRRALLRAECETGGQGRLSAAHAGGSPEVVDRREPPKGFAREAALRLLSLHGKELRRTACRFAGNHHDAEDAVQRSLEIFLEKAPRTTDEELLAWLKTVIKHEAFSIRRRQRRVELRGDGPPDSDQEPVTLFGRQGDSPSEHLERYEKLRAGAEILGSLKPQESLALSLLAQGYSYQEISERTGWTYTKVNRCLAEGRQSFRSELARMEAEDPCRHWEQPLRAVAAGAVDTETSSRVRRHLKYCVGCRSTLRRLMTSGAAASLWPSGLGSFLSDVVVQAREMVTALRMRVEGLCRNVAVNIGGTGPDTSVSEGLRALVTTTPSKALALLFLSGAGAGGAVAGLSVGAGDTLAGDRPTSSGTTLTVRGDRAKAHSPDIRLLTERFRSPAGDGEKRAVASSSSSGINPSITRPSPRGRDQELSVGVGVDAPVPVARPRPRQARRRTSGRQEVPSSPSMAPSDANSNADEKNPYGSGVPGACEDTEYGCGVPASGSSETEYGSGIPG
jgi:RNA polymerase sigma factor (sigma-70 family)